MCLSPRRCGCAKRYFDWVLVTTRFQGYWQTNIDALYLNGQKIASTIDTIIDSGTSMILGDNQTVQAFYDQIPGSRLVGSGYYSSTEDFVLSHTERSIDLLVASSLLIRFRNLSLVWWH
jgi:hypothetical protein